jgi:hypothetical protein
LLFRELEATSSLETKVVAAGASFSFGRVAEPPGSGEDSRAQNAARRGIYCDTPFAARIPFAFDEIRNLIRLWPISDCELSVMRTAVYVR